MALITHLKLDGNTNDSSGRGKNFTNDSVLFYDAKLGQAYYNDGNYNRRAYRFDSEYELQSNFTYTAWINSTGITTTGATFYQFALSNNRDCCNLIGISIGVVNSSGNIVIGYSNQILFTSVNARNKWVHVAVVIGVNNVKIYFDGVLTYNQGFAEPFSYNGEPLTIGKMGHYYYGPDGYFAWYGFVEDVRFYDHPLSALEVKQLAQAKALHYNFNEFQEPTTNLLGGQIIASYDNWGTNSGTSNNFTSGEGTPGVSFNMTSYTDGGVRWYWTGGTRSCTQNTTYTVSAIVKYTTNPHPNMFYLRQYGASGQISEGGLYSSSNNTNYGGGWTLAQATFTTLSGVTAFAFEGYQYSVNKIELYSLQVEQKGHATPFVTTSRTGIIQDKSGLENNTTLLEVDTPRYVTESKLGQGSYYFDGVNDFMNLTSISNYPLNGGVTFAVWAKPTSNATWSRFMDFGNGAGVNNLLFAREGSTSNLALHSYGATTGSMSVNALENNVWQHLAFTINSSGGAKIYKNGQLISSSVLPVPTVINRSNMYVGRSNWAGDAYYQGYMDDIRLYSTTLSDAEILDIYQTRAQISSNGRLHARHLQVNTNYDKSIENTNLVLNGDGSFGNLTGWSGVFDGYDAGQNAFYATGSYRTMISNTRIEVQGNGIDKFDQYVIDAEHKQPSGPTSYYFFMIVCYDKDDQFIDNIHVTHDPATRTTLAQTLNPGDSVLYLTSSASWSTQGGGSDHFTQQIAMFPNGHPYPDYTYSRIHTSYKSISGNIVTLNSPWSGAQMPAGTRIMNTQYGGTFSYIGGAFVPMTTDWLRRTATTSATINNGNMRAGSKYFRVGWLLDYNGTGTTSYFRNIKAYNITNPGQATMFSTDDFEITNKSFKVQHYSTVGLTRNLIGHWPLEKDTLDISGYNRHGTASGAVLKNESYYFDGVNDTISFGTGDTFFPLNSFTISIMFKSDGTTPTTGTVPGLFGFTYGIRAIIIDGGIWFGVFRTDGNAYINDSTKNYFDSEWHHLIATCDGSTIKLYVDGAFKGSNTISSFWNGYTSWPTNVWRIGSDNNDGFLHFRGNMKQLKMFSFALTEQEIKLEYNTMFKNEVQISKDGVLHAKDVIEY
jgi:hypothetical protein